jgi:hypothetical protein
MTQDRLGCINKTLQHKQESCHHALASLRRRSYGDDGNTGKYKSKREVFAGGFSQGHENVQQWDSVLSCL